MAMRLPTGTRNALAQVYQVRTDAGAGPGTVKIYTGAGPASADSAVTGTLLATVVLGDPSFGAANAGTITGADPAAVDPVASGTAGWFRVLDSDGATVWDGTVSATGGGGDMQLSNTSLAPGISTDITAFSITQPAS